MARSGQAVSTGSTGLLYVIFNGLWQGAVDDLPHIRCVCVREGESVCESV